MPDYESLYPGRFLKKELLPAPKVVRITAVNTTELENDKNETEVKVTVKYKAADGDGEMVFCKTNAALTAIALNERDYSKWPTHLITLHNNPNVSFGGKKVGGVRVCGSPEMTKAQKVEIKMPRRKKPDVYHLTPTDKKGNPITGTAKSETPAASSDDFEPPISPDDAPPLDSGPAWEG
jgi:hypothetical protein